MDSRGGGDATQGQGAASQAYFLASMDIAELVAHDGLHVFVGLLAGAVAGQEAAGIGFEPAGDFVLLGAVGFRVARFAHQVKASHHHAREFHAPEFPGELLEDVEDSAVSAAGDYRAGAGGADVEALLMGEIVLDEGVAILLHYAPVGGRERVLSLLDREKAYASAQIGVAIQEADLREREDGLVDSDVAVALPGTIVGVVLAARAALHVDRGRGVECREGEESAGVVVVSVAQDRHVDLAEVDAEPFGVLEGLFRWPCVEEYLLPGRLDAEREPVRSRAPFNTRSVLYQIDDPHGKLSAGITIGVDSNGDVWLYLYGMAIICKHSFDTGILPHSVLAWQAARRFWRARAIRYNGVHPKESRLPTSNAR